LMNFEKKIDGQAVFAYNSHTAFPGACFGRGENVA